ncbi:DUF2752 domain-containing protein [Pontibacter qinzhouensis]|uniref:DUF2752 domain-containing protein n=1 Tax=Pontibacter qinzhouensis TaxID=2603253 RepID=A0A5C8KDR3_9BACT|nr:DUF2752 domain-containing protein [Pontibacter qinzhouensis]TXK52885.1 DUF2752 domain-containing protein [Pontibacter qinzhouensis]
MKQYRVYWNYGKLFGLICLPLLLLCLPASFFDEGQSMCLSVLLADTECHGCGMTRAIMHLIHFDFATALTYNKLSVIVLPVLIYLWGQTIYQEFLIYRRHHAQLTLEKKRAEA